MPAINSITDNHQPHHIVQSNNSYKVRNNQSYFNPHTRLHNSNNSSFSGNNNLLIQIFRLIINLIKSLQSRTLPPQNNIDLPIRAPEPDTKLPVPNASDLKSPKDAPKEAVKVTGFAGFTIGATVGTAPNSIGSLVDNDTVVDIKGRKFTVGFLKQQVEDYKQSSFLPGPINSNFVTKDWAFGSDGINAFENFIVSSFPNGQPKENTLNIKSPANAPVGLVQLDNLTIGQTQTIGDNFATTRRNLDNNEIVDIKGSKYTIGFLKTQGESFKNSSFYPTGAQFSIGIIKPWGIGNFTADKFEDFIKANFPSGQPIPVERHNGIGN